MMNYISWLVVVTNCSTLVYIQTDIHTHTESQRQHFDQQVKSELKTGNYFSVIHLVNINSILKTNLCQNFYCSWLFSSKYFINICYLQIQIQMVFVGIIYNSNTCSLPLTASVALLCLILHSIPYNQEDKRYEHMKISLVF